MFTGIVTAIGTIQRVEQRGDLHVTVACPFDPATIAVGASIACSGVCLTVVDRGGEPGAAWFTVDVSAETVSRTAKGMWHEGRRINLEPSLRLGDEMGGHIVSGHVDGLGRIVSVTPEGGSHRIEIEAPAPLHRYIAPKGSITVDGVSLTVNAVEGPRFEVNIIPHTWEATTLGALKPGDAVNLEIDMLARYLARWQETA